MTKRIHSNRDVFQARNADAEIAKSNFIMLPTITPEVLLRVTIWMLNLFGAFVYIVEFKCQTRHDAKSV